MRSSPPNRIAVLLDLFEPEEEAIEEKPFTAKQGKQVYRFRASRGKKQFVIEAQGNNTLGDLDAAMREAFELDTCDHLSEFTLVTPRGKASSRAASLLARSTRWVNIAAQPFAWPGWAWRRARS